MKNYEKYETAKERERAFVDYCQKHKDEDCASCLVDKRCREQGAIMCTFAWLELDDEPPKCQSNLMDKFSSKE